MANTINFNNPSPSGLPLSGNLKDITDRTLGEITASPMKMEDKIKFCDLIGVVCSELPGAYLGAFSFSDTFEHKATQFISTEQLKWKTPYSMDDKPSVQLTVELKMFFDHRILKTNVLCIQTRLPKGERADYRYEYNLFENETTVTELLRATVKRSVDIYYRIPEDERL